MPLHLLGKKSWNVYNAAAIARVKADEDAAATREAAQDQRLQEHDAIRRAAILRGQTPPPELEEQDRDKEIKTSHACGRERKRRKRRGEDDTDADIRWASSLLTKNGDDDDPCRGKMLKLRASAEEAPLMDNAGNINLFPVDAKKIMKRDRNAEAESEKKKKEQAFEDQYCMRFSNAAGQAGLEKPWYAADTKQSAGTEPIGTEAVEYAGFEDKNVWGKKDPRRRERAQARISSSDPFAFMQRAQAQLQHSKLDKKKWHVDRERELRELKASEVHGRRRHKHHRRGHSTERERSPKGARQHQDSRRMVKERSHHRSRSRSRSRDRRRPATDDNTFNDRPRARERF